MASYKKKKKARRGNRAAKLIKNRQKKVRTRLRKQQKAGEVIIVT